MRICYISGGNFIHVHRLANFFAANGHEVYLISTTELNDYGGYDERVKIYPLVRLFPGIWQISKYLSGLIWLFQLRRLVRKIHPDILDAQFIKINGYLGVISGIRPLVLTAWGSDILFTARLSWLHRILISYCLKKADSIVCRSPVVREEIIKLGAQADKINIILIGVDTDKFAPRHKNEEFRQNLGFADSAPMVISTRSLEPVYDLETLVKAVPLVLKEIPETKFVIAGQGSRRHYLEDLAGSLQVADSVKFVGLIPHDELPQYLASSDVYVSTSLSDGTSNSLLEAMASSLAPVVTDIPANRLWIDDGKNGALFTVSEPEFLAARIVHLLKRNELRKKFGEMNTEIARQRAEHQVEMKKLEKLYSDLVKRRRGQ